MKKFISGLLALSSCVLLAGCEADMRVDFVNNTDSILYLYAAGTETPKWELPAHETTKVDLVAKEQCTTAFKVFDASGRTVKDPGRVCWHGTYSIP